MFIRRSQQFPHVSSVRVAELLFLIKSKSADTRIVYIALSINLVFSSTSTPLEDKESTFWISTSLEAKLVFSLTILTTTRIRLRLGVDSSKPATTQTWGWTRFLLRWPHFAGISALLRRGPAAPFPAGPRMASAAVEPPRPMSCLCLCREPFAATAASS